MNSLTVLCIFTLLVGVFSHAKLEYPKPYNPNPSTTSPCGGAAALLLPSAIWTQGDSLNITWTIVASDGNGVVSMAIDTTGGLAFTSAQAVSIPLVGTNPTTGPNRPYTYTFTVPMDLTCTSSNKMCPVQVKTSANWFACTNVEVRAYVAPSASSTGSSSDPTADVNAVQCETISGSSGVIFCNGKIGANVQIGAGETAYNVDQYVKNTYYQNINKTTVFANGTSNPECGILYKDFLCDLSFPPCGTAVSTGLRTGGSCQKQCSDTMTACGVTNIHVGLYPCDSYPLTCFGCRLSVVSLMASVVLPLFMTIYNRL